jgi:cytidine deaminase
MSKYLELKKIIKHAYAPYSHYRVSAIVETDKGDYYGVNIENVSYSLTICAERNAMTNAIAHGAKQFRVLHLLADHKTIPVPCGACLQFLSEFFKPNTKIICYAKDGKKKSFAFKQLFPHAFNKQSIQ